VAVDGIQGNHPIGASHDALATVDAFFRINLYGAGFSVPLDQIFRTRSDANSTLPTYRRIVDGWLPPQDVNRRALNIYDSLSFQ
jgi:hypothetical protein